MKFWYYGNSLPSSSKSGLGEADNSTICVEVGEKRKKRRPQSDDKDWYKIAKYATDCGPNQTRFFQYNFWNLESEEQVKLSMRKFDIS